MGCRDPIRDRHAHGTHGRRQLRRVQPDGGSLLSGSDDDTVRLWDIELRQEVAAFSGHAANVNSVAFSPDGRILASGSDDATVRLWDAGVGRAMATLTGHTGGVNSVAFSPDGRALATGGDDHTVMLWDVASARDTATLTGHNGRVIMVAFSQDGGGLVSGRSTGGWRDGDLAEDAIRRWDAVSRRQVGSFGGAVTQMRWLGFSPDGATLAAAGSEGDIAIWDAATWQPAATLPGQAGPFAFTPNGATLATSGSDGVTLWDTTSWRQTGPITERATSLAFSADGAFLAISGDVVTLWNVASGQRAATLAAQAKGSYQVAFSPDGAVLASGGRDYTIWLWDAERALELGRTLGPDVPLWADFARLPGHTSDITTMTFSPDSRLLASGGRDGMTRLWDIATREQVAALRDDGRVYAVAFSPDGRTIATDGLGSSAKLWDVASGEQIAAFGEHFHFQYTMAYSPDGTLLANGLFGVFLWGVDNPPEVPTAVDPRAKAGSTWAQVKGAALTPGQTAFLPNYPNPFNPETWIPFDLRAAAKVSISIHDAEGRLVRGLELGERPAGAYRTRDRAAYWDGRNEQGELVSSGVYFAEMIVGGRRSARRIALRK